MARRKKDAPIDLAVRHDLTAGLIESLASYRFEKQQVVAELAEVRRRGEDQAAHLAKLEADALRNELLGRQR